MTDDDDPADTQPEDDALQDHPTVDAGSVRQYRKRKLSAKVQQRRADEFWQRVFADPVGRAEMWAMLQSGHAFEERFACGPNGFPQTEATWFHAGEQAFAQRLFQSWAIVARDGVFLMLDEHDPRFTARAKPKRGEP